MKYLTENLTWVSFYPKFNQSFYVEKAGYFDERPQINTSITQLLMLVSLPFLAFQSLWFLLLFPLVFFGWGKLYIKLPIRTGIQDCESACWGFNYHDNKIWIYVGRGGNFEGGRKWRTVRMPWDMEWVRTSILLKDGKTWVNSIRGDRKEFYLDEWKEPNIVFIETHPYTDLYDGTVVNATIRVNEMEWRPVAFQWTSLFSKSRKSIDIEFDNEVGVEKCSWKGGCIGCSFELLPNETPLECLRRMESERKF